MCCTDGLADGQMSGGVASIGSGESTPFSVMCIDDNVLLIDALERRLNLEPGFRPPSSVEDLATSVDVAADSTIRRPSRHRPPAVWTPCRLLDELGSGCPGLEC
jgi:hypothetical protein